jgi:hypothetical protein
VTEEETTTSTSAELKPIDPKAERSRTTAETKDAPVVSADEAASEPLDDRDPGTSDNNPTLSSPDRLEPRGTQTSAAAVTAKNLAVFLKRSGYEKSDVISASEAKRTYVTSNGGKYQLTKQGEIRILKGPDYPALTEEKAEADAGA